MPRRDANEQRLEELESDFRPLLIDCLEACAAGRWGFFKQNQGEEIERYLKWFEADRLADMAWEIRALRAQFGSVNQLVERFLYYSSLRGSNVPGEPKLAKAFLDEIQQSSL